MIRQIKSWHGLIPILFGGLFCLLVTAAWADTHEIKPLQVWQGRVETSLQPAAPRRGYLANQAELDKLWAAWRIPGGKPAVDFKSHLVLVGTCPCSHISITPRVNEHGDLRIQVTMTKDLREDTGYCLVLIPRQGIRTVEGKPLEAD